MSLDKRYPAFIVILAVFLGFFLFTSDAVRQRPPEEGAKADASHGAASISTAGRLSSSPVFPLDLNSASADDLALLPGIGEKTARRIVEKRAEMRGFRSVDDLLEVKWVGRSKLEKIRGLVKVEGSGKKKQGAS